MKKERYGRLEYSKTADEYQLVDAFDGERITVNEGQPITIGHLMGHTIRAVPYKDQDGSWGWCISKLPRIKPPFDGVVSLRER